MNITQTTDISFRVVSDCAASVLHISLCFKQLVCCMFCRLSIYKKFENGFDNNLRDVGKNMLC